MVTIINMTDHPVVVIRNGEVVRRWEPSGEVLRMDEKWVNTGFSFNDAHPDAQPRIPVLRREVGSLRVVTTATGAMEMFNPNEYQHEHDYRVLFIVSSQVLMAFPAIGTLICPAQIVREGGRQHGRILGCEAFSTNSPPHLNDVELKAALGYDF